MGAAHLLLIEALDSLGRGYKMVIIMGLCFAMGLAMLQALYRWMKELTLKKEPGGAMLDEHLWAHVLQHLDTLQDYVKAATSCRAAWKAGLIKLDVPVHMPSEGWQFVLRRGCTAISLSVPSQQQSASDCLGHAFSVLRSQGLEMYVYDLGTSFPVPEQMTTGKRCMTETSKALSQEDSEFGDCPDVRLQFHFGHFLLKVRVVNVVAPTLMENSSLFQQEGSLCSSFSRLRHLTLMIDPRRCYLDNLSPGQLDASLAGIGQHSQLESLYIGIESGFECSRSGSDWFDPEDSANVCLSHMQHLKSVHLDSFWPALLELPPGASLHATFKFAPGQKHPGLWAGKATDVQNPRLPLRSVHFLPGPGLGPEHTITAKELWPLKVKKHLDLIRVRVGTLHLDLFYFPGLIQAERVLIAASECRLTIPGNRVAYKHLTLRYFKRVQIYMNHPAAFAARCQSLTVTWRHPMDLNKWYAGAVVARNIMLAAGRKVYTTRCGTLWQPEGKKEPWSFYRGNAILGVSYGSMEPSKWDHAVRCCCHACLACLHRDGTADFPEAIAEENVLFGV